MVDTTTPGRRLLDAIAGKDQTALREILDPAVEFRAMTPGRFWEADSPDEVIATLSVWFGADDLIEGIEKVESESFAGVEHVDYRLLVRSGGQMHVVGQQAYLTTTEGRITWLRIMCAGYRPLD